ncbi:aminoacyl-tRNA hydrolase [Cellulomonas citrea]|uniref:aminoacyl-tRNA hydrolase n=1 Tax=Cellulomonas citrea TaxID=1909423 RepID=UPI001358DEC5|nr:aminoacyl-tRNA hydrolase [Cellulomonas citrea]
MAQGPWLVVGLGNPGPQYAGNRHNVGAMVLDELARRCGQSFAGASGPLGRRPQALTADVRLGVLPGGAPGPRALLVRPTTYMNVSGGPVGALARYHGVDVAQVLVVHDELDLPFATVRLKRGGGEGGHNGLRDITRALGTKDYLRVRVGIGRPPGRQDPADFVLKDFTSAERADLGWLLDRAADAVEAIVTQGLEPAQQEFHAPS